MCGRYALRTAAHKRNTTKPETQSQRYTHQPWWFSDTTTAFQQCKRIKFQLVKEPEWQFQQWANRQCGLLILGRNRLAIAEETISGNDFELFEVLKWAYDPK
jgi:hypothetical protein